MENQRCRGLPAEQGRQGRLDPDPIRPGRRLNGNGALWRSFHFKVVGSNWVAILHDQGRGKKPCVIFIEREPGTEFGGRFSNFERMISQLPSDLRLQLQEHANLFTQT